MPAPVARHGNVSSRDPVVNELDVPLEPSPDLLAELEQAHADLKTAHEQLQQSEKLASIGQLAAGVAHEINNPVGYVNSNLGSLAGYLDQLFELLDAHEALSATLPAEHAGRRQVDRIRTRIELPFLRQDMLALIGECREGIHRVTRIVQNLKDFSRMEPVEWQHADLHQGLEKTLDIVWNELKYKAEVIREYGELPAIECVPSQLNQVFMNLLVNAAQAIDEHGTIRIRSGFEADHQQVWIEIEDTGKGIAPEHLSRIFDPFFTTKPVGKGTGLGLSLSYGIIQAHRGTILADSRPGAGARFRIVLPVCQGRAAAAETG